MPHLLAWGDASRVENAVESGMPDISYAIEGVQGWIETKLVRRGLLHFEKFQLAWLRKRLRHAHDNLWIFAVDDKGEAFYVYSALQVIMANRVLKRDWLVINVSNIGAPLVYGSNAPWPWEKVHMLLARLK